MRSWGIKESGKKKGGEMGPPDSYRAERSETLGEERQRELPVPSTDVTW
jgi:hypothetical protein